MPQMIDAAQLDALFRGVAYGDVAKILANSGMDVRKLRTNATLRYDEWKAIDERVVEITKQRMVGVQDLVSAGLSYNLGNGLGTTVLQWETESDMDPASVNMDAAVEGPYDRPEYELNYLPIPITHRDFQISIRDLEASRKLGSALDVTMAGIAARRVAEMNEQMLFNGTNGVTFGGGTVYGYTNHPDRNTLSLGTSWVSETGPNIVTKVIAAKQASINDRHYGPWNLYVPTNFDSALDNDFSTAKGDLTIRERIKKIDGIKDVKTADFLTASNVLLVEMQPETVQIVIGMQPTTIEWQAYGGMVFHFKIMDIVVPWIRSDQDGRSGIVHLS